MVRFFILVFSLLMVFTSTAFAKARPITFVIFVDQSASMEKHTGLIQRIAVQAASKMKKYCGKYRAGVSTITYKDNALSKPRLVGKPQLVVESTPHGPEKLARRIQVLLAPKSDEQYEKQAGREEVTYSSIVSFVEFYRQTLSNQGLVAALLLSDAAPIYERKGDVKDHIRYISRLLGGSDFMATAVMASPYEKDNCSMDGMGDAVLGYHGLSGVNSPELFRLDQFVDMTDGEKLNICQKNLDAEIEQFILQVLMRAGCLIIS